MLKIASASEVTFYLSCVFYTRYPPKSKKKKKAAKQSTDIYDQSSRCSVPHHKWESVAWLRQPYGLWERYMCVLCVCWLECSRQTFMCGECWSPLGRRIHNIDLVHGMLCGVYVRLGWPPNIYICVRIGQAQKLVFITIESVDKWTSWRHFIQHTDDRSGRLESKSEGQADTMAECRRQTGITAQC